jgi:hypothetical protein
VWHFLVGEAKGHAMIGIVFGIGIGASLLLALVIEYTGTVHLAKCECTENRPRMWTEFADDKLIGDDYGNKAEFHVEQMYLATKRSIRVPIEVLHHGLRSVLYTMLAGCELVVGPEEFKAWVERTFGRE